MAQMTLTFGGHTIAVYALDRDRVTVGRRPNNDIHIENLSVSGYHAVILRTEEGCVVEDLNSTNGTLVNDTPVKRHVLQEGDVLLIGKHELVYSTHTESATPPKTGTAIDPHAVPVSAKGGGHAEPQKSERDPAIVAGDTIACAIVQLPPAAIRVLNGSRRGTELRLEHSRTRLGQAGKASAIIARETRGYVLIPTERKEEVFVNDQPPVADGHLLEDRDVVEIAGLQVEFYYISHDQ